MSSRLSESRSKMKCLVYFLIAACLMSVIFSTSIAAQKKVRRVSSKSTEKTGENSKPTTTPPAETKPEPVVNKAKRVMVTDFDARGILRWWRGEWDIGNLFSNSVIGPLSRVENYEVVERARMNAIFNEQGLLESERFSQSQITKIGRLLGADYILFGDLQDFSRRKSKNPFVKETQVSIRLSARLVSVATGKVAKSAEVTYLSPKDKDYFSFSSQEVDPNDPEFVQSIFGKAITEAAVQTVAQLTGEGNSQTVSTTAITDSTVKNTGSSKTTSGNTEIGLIADVTGNSVVINLGSSHGVKNGAQFAVVKVVKEIRDPKNPEVIIYKKTEELARIKITSVSSAASEGTLVSGKPEFLQVGTEIVRVN